LKGATSDQITLSTTTKAGGALEARELETSIVGEVTQVEASPVKSLLLSLLASYRCVTWASERFDSTPVVLYKLVSIIEYEE